MRIPEPVSLQQGNIEIRAFRTKGCAFAPDRVRLAGGTQHASFDITPDTFAGDRAGAHVRANKDVKALQAQGLIKGGSLENAIVVTETGLLNETPLRFRDEFVRHKVLDLLGDLSLLGRPLKGQVLARRSGHATNVAFVKQLSAAEARGANFNDLPPVPREGITPPWDINAIMSIMPHRYPLLLVDRILDMTDERVIGTKCVTINEPFFNGHFPGHPIMPAVLIVEAMAQCGGILLLNKVDRPREKLVYFMAENAKFRKPVLLVIPSGSS
jgi:UDP-3-O-[3-hydroxymyristoyl] N-acetylglucosamine deacetylase/3-hydroxyacyl-[acyl-carrier-protein] dehydratase